MATYIGTGNWWLRSQALDTKCQPVAGRPSIAGIDSAAFRSQSGRWGSLRAAGILDEMAQVIVPAAVVAANRCINLNGFNRTGRPVSNIRFFRFVPWTGS